MKYFTIIIFILTSALLGFNNIAKAKDTMTEMQWNTDLYGHDYAGMDIKISDPTLCQELCANDPKCIAWTYIKPNTVQGPNPRCWLKNQIGPPRNSSHCISGIKILESKSKMIPQIFPTQP